MCIVVEGLVQDSDDEQLAFRAGCFFGKLLEEVDVPAVIGDVLEELAHFVDQDEQAVRRGFGRGSDLIDGGGVDSPLASVGSGFRDSIRDREFRIGASSYDGHNNPVAAKVFL